MTRRERRRTAIALVLATVGAGIVLALGVFAATTVLAVYVVVLGAVVLAPLTRLAQTHEETQPSIFELSLKRTRASSTRPPELVRIERELVAGLETAGGLHRRLGPLLRDAAAVRLAATRRIDLVHQPDAAHAALGDDAWELVRPDRPAPRERTGAGVPVARIRMLLDTLEQL